METKTKKCPFCAEEVKFEAIKCKHCGESLVEKSITENRTKKNQLKKSTLFSIGLLISYFLPWYSTSIFNFNGYEISICIDKCVLLENFIDINISILKVSYVFFLIPICAAFNIISDIANIKNYSFLNEFAIGLSSTLILYSIIKLSNVDYTNNLSIGYYLTITFSILGFVFSSQFLQNIFNIYIKKTKNITNNISFIFIEKLFFFTQIQK